MKLADLLAGLDWRCPAGSPDLEVTGVSHDSRRIKPGVLFVCLAGLRFDGRLFIPDALRRGARAVVVQSPWAPVSGETVIAVPDTRRALAVCCANWHGNPARELIMIGITGTNGKTTTAFFLDSILGAAGARAGLIGTIHNKIGDLVLPSTLTTPEPGELHGLLRRMAEAGAGYCTMEVSSHALAQDRVAGLDFDVGVFTNISLEHLEYHADMEEYLSVKSRLIEQSRCAVLNRDDEASYARLRSEVHGTWLDYGFAGGALVRGEIMETLDDGPVLIVYYQSKTAVLPLALPGRYNAYNALAAAAAALALGLDFPAIAGGLSRVRGIPGRFEEISLGQPFRVIVDYAHTPDGLSKFLAALRDSTEGRLILIFGARGGRDRNKRHILGAIAARQADYCYITADSPNDEPPEQILRDLEQGYLSVKSRGYEIVPDRETAIGQAVRAARPGDTVTATGRGHEAEYRVGAEVFRLKDGDAFRRALESLTPAAPVLS